MGMPVADIVEPAVEVPSDLASLGYPIRDECCRASVIRPPRPGSAFDPNDVVIESSKKLSASFRAVVCQLSMAIKVNKNRIG